MIRFILICWLVMLLVAACGPAGRVGVCRHNALYAATVYGEDYPTRIFMGPTPWPDVWHAQAAVKIGGKWQWLQVQKGKVIIGKKEDFEAVQSHSTKEFMSYIPVAKDWQ